MLKFKERFKKNLALNNKGFTMLEIIAVIVVIALLMVVLVPRLTGGADRAKEIGVSKDMKDLADGIETMFTENSRIPAIDGTAAGETAFVTEFSNYVDSYFAINEGSVADDSIFETDTPDPFDSPYKIIVHKDDPLIPGILEKVLIYSDGKTQTTGKADFMTLLIYENGQTRRVTVGFKGDTQAIALGTYTAGTGYANVAADPIVYGNADTNPTANAPDNSLAPVLSTINLTSVGVGGMEIVAIP